MYNNLLTAEILSTSIAAIMMFMMNITGSQIVAGLTPGQRKILQSPYIRWIAIIAIFYVGSRNIYITLILSILAIAVLEYLLNESSRYYLFCRQLPNGKLHKVGSGALNIWKST